MNQNLLFPLIALLLGLSLGVLAESQLSQHLLLTHLEKRQAEEIKILTDKVNEQAEAAQADADARAKREALLDEQIKKLLEEALKNAGTTVVISPSVATAIDAAGGLRDSTEKR